MKLKNKKGIALNQAFGAVLALVLVATLVIIAVSIFGSLQSGVDELAITSVTNETVTGAFTDGTTRLVTNASLCRFRSFAVTACSNGTGAGALLIPSTNYSVLDYGLINASGDSAYYNGSSWDCTYTGVWGGPSCEASRALGAQFLTFPALIGLVGVIIFLGLVIGILVASFVFGSRGGI